MEILSNQKLMNYIANSEIKVTNTKEKELFMRLLVQESLRKVGNPFGNLTVAQVAKDLHCNQNTANEIFRRPDFPSINVGKSKKVMFLAYILWKLERKEKFEYEKKRDW